MFERYTERARQVVVLAQDESRTLKHNYIGTEHLLLGLLREEEGLASRVLDSFDVTLEEVRQQIRRIVGEGDEATSGQVQFSPRAKKMLELALREALSLGHNYIGTEHILLGMVREGTGTASRILTEFGATDTKIRDELIRVLSLAQRKATTDPQEVLKKAVGLKSVESPQRTTPDLDHAMHILDMAKTMLEMANTSVNLARSAIERVRTA